MTGWVKGIGLLALGVLVGRLIWAALTRSVEYDEAISLMVVRGVPSPAWPEGVSTAGALRAALGQGVADPLSLLRDLRASDVHPPLYFILLAGWVGAVGDSLLALRLPSLLMTLACGLPLVGIARMLLGRERAPLALLALACSPVLMILGALARGYGLATLLLLVAVWGALALREAARRDHLPLGPQVALGLGAGLAPWAVHLAGLVVPVVLLWSLAQGRGRRRRLRWWLPLALALPLGLGWLWYVSGQLGNRPDQGGNPLAPVDVAVGLSLQIQALALGLPRPMAGSWAIVNLILGGLLSVALLVLAYATLIKGWLRPKAGWGLIWLTILAALMAPVALGAFSGKLLLAPRYLVMAAPLLGLVLVAAMLRLSSRQQSTPPNGLALTLLGGLAAVQLGLGGSMEAGGLTRPERWQAISDTLTGQQVALILIDAGFGRGVPASLALSLPADQPVQVVRGASCDVAEPLPASAALVLSWHPGSRQAATVACAERFAGHRQTPAEGHWIDSTANNPGPPFILFTRQ